jgi:glycerophosphoryl diester phosphodiesterase
MTIMRKTLTVILTGAAIVLTGSAAHSTVLPGPVHKATVPAVLPPVIAHRGGGAGGASGTLAGFVDAAKAGAPTLEMDVRFTKATAASPAGVPVVWHDSTKDGYPIAGESATFWAAHGVSSLYAVLAATQAYGVAYVAEFKTDPTPAQLALYVSRFDDFGLRGRLTVESFLTTALRKMQAAHPDIRTALINSAVLSPATVRSYGTAYLPEYTIITPAYVAALHAAGVTAIWPWTPDTTATWQAMATAGVDGIVTDDTDTYLAQQHHGSPLAPTH